MSAAAETPVVFGGITANYYCCAFEDGDAAGKPSNFSGA